MNRNADDIFRSLKPTALDQRAAETHARRRERDLAQALAQADGPSETPGAVPERRRGGLQRRRTIRILAAGLAAGAVAAAVTGVLATGRAPGDRPAPVRATSRTPDARTFLLASAETIAKAPAEFGAYWYTRERETSFLDGPAQRRQRKQLIAKNPKMAARLKRAKPVPPVRAFLSTTEEAWYGRDRHDRTIVGIDPKVTFPTPADRAKWTALGSPSLFDGADRRTVSNYDFSDLKMARYQADKAVDAVHELPTDERRLAKVLHRWYRDDHPGQGGPTDAAFAGYVFGTAQDLLAGPTTPGTKAALFRLLARQPGIHYLGTATDPMGRAGAEVARGSGGGEMRLIVDPGTGRLLAQESGDRTTPQLTMTYEAMGWVKHLDARP